MSEQVSVALIGAGRTGTPLLRELFKYPYIQVVGVADLNSEAEGIQLAKGKGIFTTTDPMDLVKKGEAIDILIEVSGDAELKKRIKDYFEQIGNKKTIIMHDLIARLFVSVATQQANLISTFHPFDVGVGD